MISKEMENNKKIYVEFIGLSGVGKTTIRNALAKELQESTSVLTEEMFFRNRSRVYKHLVPIILNFKKAISLYFFWHRNKGLLSGLFGKKYEKNNTNFYLFKKSVVCSFLFSKDNFKCFLGDSYLFLVYYLEKDSKIEKIKKLYNIKSNDEIIFIFIDSPPEVAYKRRVKREGEVIRYDKMQEYKALDKERTKIYSSLSKKGVDRVVKINGEDCVKKNIRLLRKQLLKFF